MLIKIALKRLGKKLEDKLEDKMRRKDKLLHITKLNNRLNENKFSWDGQYANEHHTGEYAESIMSMTVGEFLDTLQSRDKTGYEVVEKVLEANFNETVGEGDREDYHYPFDNPESDSDDDPYELKEKIVQFGDDIEIVDEDCGCGVNESEPTDVEKSQWFSDTDGERLTDKCMDC